MTKYTFLFVALLLILLPFFGLKEAKQTHKPVQTGTVSATKAEDAKIKTQPH